jgi:hypothetical protein
LYSELNLNGFIYQVFSGSTRVMDGLCDDDEDCVDPAGSGSGEWPTSNNNNGHHHSSINGASPNNQEDTTRGTQSKHFAYSVRMRTLGHSVRRD